MFWSYAFITIGLLLILTSFVGIFIIFFADEFEFDKAMFLWSIGIAMMIGGLCGGGLFATLAYFVKVVA